MKIGQSRQIRFYYKLQAIFGLLEDPILQKSVVAASILKNILYCTIHPLQVAYSEICKQIFMVNFHLLKTNIKNRYRTDNVHDKISEKVHFLDLNVYLYTYIITTYHIYSVDD